jgi:HSP20 family protein
MTLTRYEPWSLHRALLNEFTRALDSNSQDASSGATADWAPSVDIAEYADKFVLSADIPGVDPASVEVTLENGVLTLAGTREKAVEPAGVERRRVERATGRFFRRFALPDTIDGEAVSASGKHGVLEIVIPKRPASQPRRITVTH